MLTSLRRIKSFTTLITLPIVASRPPSSLSGRAKSIVWPLRRRPRDNSWLLIYSDAVRRLSGSIFARATRAVHQAVESNLVSQSAHKCRRCAEQVGFVEGPDQDRLERCNSPPCEAMSGGKRSNQVRDSVDLSSFANVCCVSSVECRGSSVRRCHVNKGNGQRQLTRQGCGEILYDWHVTCGFLPPNRGRMPQLRMWIRYSHGAKPM